MTSPRPRSWVEQAAVGAAFYLVWKALIILAAAVGSYLLAGRLVRWSKVTDNETLEALLAGGPFLLMLLIAFHLKH